MGKVLDKKETLSPLAHMFMVKEWLHKIHPDLPNYVMQNEGQLFTADKPTLACNQQLLCDKMESMLQKLKDKEDISTSNVTVGYLSTGHGGGRGGSRPFRGGNRSRQPYRGQSSRQGFSRPDKQDCYICLEAGRTDAALFHTARDCKWRFQPRSAAPAHQLGRSNQNFKVLLVQQQAGTNSSLNDGTDQLNNLAVSGQSHTKKQDGEVYQDLYRGEDEDDEYEIQPGQNYYGGATLEEL